MGSVKFSVARQILLAGSILGGITLPAGHAFAQAAVDASTLPPPSATSNQPQADDQKTKGEEIVVTGSRIPRTNFNTPSPLVVITKDQITAGGTRSIADVLQSASITSGTSQINSSFLGFLSDNGAAANTVGLRGLGAQRTLVLLNGRRLAPAGVGPELVATDLNVLPDAVISRVDILRAGASSIYGSDAIAGVINIITDSKVNGITVDGYDDQPLHTGGAGGTMRGSITAGKVFDRGHITASFEYRNQRGLTLGDRKETSCPRDLLFDPKTGAEVGAIDPATGGLSCFPYALGSGAGTAGGYGIAQSFTLPASRLTYTNAGDPGSVRAVNGLTRVSPAMIQEQQTVISPVKTYTGYLNGSYQLDMLGDAEIYTESLFTRRESHQNDIYQFSVNTANLSRNIQIYGGSYAGTPLSDYGYPTSPFFPNAVANSGYQVFTPFSVLDHTIRSSQRIDYLRTNGGLRGDIGLGNWRYDANVQYSRTWAKETIPHILTSRLDNSLQAVAAPAGTPSNLITYATAGQAGAGNGYTCASNVAADGTFIAGSSCVPLNMYDPSFMLGGHMPANAQNYLFQNSTDHTRFEELTGSLNLNGTLFDLPGGPAGASLGYEHRHEKLKDTPSAAAQAGDLYNYSSGGITQGTDTIDEVYGEIDLPFFRDKPFMKNVELDLSGRYTHYKSYGTDFTYHITGQWQPADVIRFRGNYGTSFRAPNLYELYLAHQTGFYGSGVDPCANVASLDPTSPTYTNCVAQLTPILGATRAQNFIATAGPEVTTEGGAGHLKAEKSTTWGFGTILTAPQNSVGALTFSVDYWNITVKNEVSQLGNLILNRCYEATDFPNNQYCALIDPRFGANAPQAGNLVSFQNPYLNVALQKASGLDFDLDFRRGLAGGQFELHVQATRNLHQKFQLFSTDPIVDYNGTLGEQGAGAGPKWVGNLDGYYTFAGGKISLHYGLKYVGSQDSTDDVGPYTAALGLGLVNTIFKVHPYFEHMASVQIEIDKASQLTIGCNNLTNSHPPLLSAIPSTAGEFTRIGNYYNSSNYDYYGRSIFMHITHTF